MFYYLNVQLYHIQDKSRFVCAHIGQKRNIYPPSIYGVYFDSYPLPLLRRLMVGAAIEKIFFDFIFSFLLFDFYSYFIFYFFQIPSLYSSDFDFPITGS